ncbi:MAG TPA: hypothetical protein VH186_34120 [Chloroflexia bacterium]|nr:hypothetical protein [Chloroflexia bacterium]
MTATKAQALCRYICMAKMLLSYGAALEMMVAIIATLCIMPPDFQSGSPPLPL